MKNKKLLLTIISISAVLIVGLTTCLAVFLPRENKKSGNSLKKQPTIEATTGASTADASEKGGAVYLTNGVTYTMKAGGFINFDKTYGGAVYVSSGCTFNMEGGVIRAGEAEYGGAIYIENGGTANIYGGTIENCKAIKNALDNTVGGSGGAIYVEQGGTLNIIGEVKTETSTLLEGTSVSVSFIGNTAEVDGGAIYVESSGKLNANGCEILRSEATRYGGGIYVGETRNASTIETNEGENYFSLNIGSDVIIKENKSVRGGGLYLVRGKNTISGTIDGNESTERGGGVYVEQVGKNVFTSESSIINNTSANGGGVYANCGSYITSGFNNFYGKINNNYSESNGGGVYLYSGTNNFGEDSVLNENSASGDGGGVYVSKNSNNSFLGEIANNISSKRGGGLFLYTGTNNIGGEVLNNESSLAGGGVWLYQGQGTVSAKIESNFSQTNGGGVYVGNGEHSITGEIISNSATGDGGGVYYEAGVLDLACEITLNSAEKGGGLCVTGTMSNTFGNEFSVSNNKATFGGGIYLNSTGTIDLPKVNVLSNNALTIENEGVTTATEESVTRFGGGIYIAQGTNNIGSYDAENDVVYGLVNQNRAEQGGGIYIADGTNSIYSQASENMATEGAGVYITKGTNNVNGSISSNIADGDGGGIYIAKGTNVISALILENAAYTDGGGIYVTSGWAGNNTFSEECIISKNTALFNGGGIYFGQATNTIKCEISENYAMNNGGGVYINLGGNVFDKTSIIKGNTAGAHGGGVYSVLNSGKNEFSGEISENKATKNGGGIYLYNGLNIFYDTSKVNGNSSTMNGGGIYINKGTNTVRGEISYNSIDASIGCGAGVCLNDGSNTIKATLISNRFTGCSDNFGGGIYLNGGTLDFGGAIRNCFATYGAGLYVGVNNTFKSNIEISDCKFSDEAAETGYFGGGIFMSCKAIFEGDVSISGCGNANVDESYGGGIFGSAQFDGNLTIQDCSASYGGGIYNSVEGNKNITITNCSSTYGGGIYGYVKCLGKLTIEGCSASHTGGGICVPKNGEVDFAGNSYYTGSSSHEIEANDVLITGNSALYGGGLAIYNETNTIIGEISNNNAKEAGGLRLSEKTTFIVPKGLTISNNRAQTQGGGLSVIYGATLNITGGTISGNYIEASSASDNLKGGGMFVAYSKATVNFSSGIIENNYIKGIKGGILGLQKSNCGGAGIYLTETGLLNASGGTLKNNYITGEYSNAAGGHILGTDEGTINIGGSTILTQDKDIKLADFGGAISSAGVFNMTGGQILNIRATYGGAIAGYGNFSITGGSITGCYASSNIGNAIVTAGELILGGNALVDGTIALGASGTENNASSYKYVSQVTIDSEGITNNFNFTLCQFSISLANQSLTPTTSQNYMKTVYDRDGESFSKKSLFLNATDYSDKLTVEGYQLYELDSNGVGLTSSSYATINVLLKEENGDVIGSKTFYVDTKDADSRIKYVLTQQLKQFNISNYSELIPKETNYSYLAPEYNGLRILLNDSEKALRNNTTSYKTVSSGDIITFETTLFEEFIYDKDESTLIGYVGVGGDIKIPLKTVKVEDSVFKDNVSITKVEFLENLQIIGNSSFSGCSGLLQLYIPDHISSIGDNAFQGCYNLTSIEVDANNTVYDSRNNCNALIETNTNSLLIGCNNTIIPNGVVNIASKAFFKCSKLATVTIPTTVVNIGADAFGACSGITKVETPSLASWLNINFENLDSNPMWVTPNENFYENGSIVDSLDFANTNTNIQEIKKYAFAGSNISGMSMDSRTNLEKIGEQAFYYSSINQFTITPKIKEIGQYAFGYTNLTTVLSLDSSGELTSIGYGAFRNCSALKILDLKGNENKELNTIVGAYAFYNCTSLENIGLKDVINIGNYAFSNCDSMTNVTLPDSLAIMGDYVFASCNLLKEITFPNNIVKIGTYAFNDCSSMEKVNVNNIDKFAQSEFGNSSSNPLFYAKKLYKNNQEITEITLSSNVTKISSYAFYFCDNIIEVTIPNSVQTIGSYAFYNCDNIIDVKIANGVQTVGANAFSYCDNLEYMLLPQSVKSVGSEAFSNCGSLKLSYLPASIQATDQPFYYCSPSMIIYTEIASHSEALNSFGYSWNVYHFDVDAGYEYYNNIVYGLTLPQDEFSLNLIKENPKLIYEGSSVVGYHFAPEGELIIPNGVESINDQVFDSCYLISSVKLGTNLTSIGAYAFDGCVNLASINIPNSVMNIGEGAFWGCDYSNLLISASMSDLEALERFGSGWNSYDEGSGCNVEYTSTETFNIILKGYFATSSDNWATWSWSAADEGYTTFTIPLNYKHNIVSYPRLSLTVKECKDDDQVVSVVDVCCTHFCGNKLKDSDNSQGYQLINAIAGMLKLFKDDIKQLVVMKETPGNANNITQEEYDSATKLNYSSYIDYVSDNAGANWINREFFYDYNITTDVYVGVMLKYE